ncbi:GTPase ObgE [Candidatus Parcubacteria bacterium]|nr:GTPase ObgE [Candidatus Parcubacteria bacterium]
MLIDDVTIKVTAGNGGKGIVAFNKTRMSLGPTGGSGGNGGNVYLKGSSNLSALKQFRFKKDLQAENGGDGKQQNNDGVTGKDLVLEVPVGTMIHNLTTKTKNEVVKINELILIAQGGKGGKGNFLFRSARNTSPKQCQFGLPGQFFTLRLELKLIADVGFIGLPNVGKSTLLNELTNAKAVVANYPFTTLEPNLGAYYDLILADIPGLIEGASTGKGLGIKFLRHIERTKILFHFISAEAENPVEDYRIIRQELKTHNKELLEKQEYLFLSRSDTVEPVELKKKISKLKKLNATVMPISIYNDEDVKKVQKILNKIAENK